MLSRIRRAPARANYGFLFDGASNLSLTGKNRALRVELHPGSAKSCKLRFVSLLRKAASFTRRLNLFQGPDFSAKSCFGMSKRGMSEGHRCRAVKMFPTLKRTNAPFFAGFTLSLAFRYSVTFMARLRKSNSMPPLFGLSSFLYLSFRDFGCGKAMSFDDLFRKDRPNTTL